MAGRLSVPTCRSEVAIKLRLAGDRVAKLLSKDEARRTWTEMLAIVVPYNKAGVLFLDGPRWMEVADRHTAGLAIAKTLSC